MVWCSNLAVALTGGKIVMMRLAGLWKECVVAYFFIYFYNFSLEVLCIYGFISV